jgi:asparagine synthetase B (glutamine-hydrolysing)
MCPYLLHYGNLNLHHYISNTPVKVCSKRRGYISVLVYDSIHVGTLLGSEDSGPYVCQAKLVFDGLGADELFAGIVDFLKYWFTDCYWIGYGRHRTAFRRGGWETLQSELELDLNRIWTRNLGHYELVMLSVKAVMYR